MRSRLPLVFLALLGVLVPAAVSAFSGGPPANRVGLCGTGQTCAGCHANPGTPSQATIAVSLNGTPAPGPPPDRARYVPNTVYGIIIDVVERNAGARCAHAARTLGCGVMVEADQCAFGFEMTAVVDASCGTASPVAAGCFTMTAADTQCTGGSCACTASPTYVEHNCAGAAPPAGTLDERVWRFEWTAPPAGTGTVHFYYYVNSANANGGSGGDQPYPGEFVLDEEIAAPSCGLLRASIASISPPPPLYKSTILFADVTSCAPESVPPGPPFIPNYTTLGTAPVEPIPGLDALVVYEVSCPCSSGTLYLRKSGTDVHADWL